VLAADYLHRKIIPQFQAFKAYCDGRETFLEKASEKLQEHVRSLESDLDNLGSHYEKKLQRMVWLHGRGKHLIQRISRVLLALSSRKPLSKKERAFYQQLKEIREENDRHRRELKKMENLLQKCEEGLPVERAELYGLSNAVSPPQSSVRQNSRQTRLPEWEVNEIRRRLSRVSERESNGKTMIEEISNALNRIISNVANKDFEEYKREEERQEQQARERNNFFTNIDDSNDRFHVSYAEGASSGIATPTSRYANKKEKPSRTSSRNKQIGIGQLRSQDITARPPPSAGRENTGIDSAASERSARRVSPMRNVSGLGLGRSSHSTEKFEKTPHSSRRRELRFETPNTRDVLQHHYEGEDNREEWGGAH
jgi:hypothetical protein